MDDLTKPEINYDIDNNNLSDIQSVDAQSCMDRYDHLVNALSQILIAQGDLMDYGRGLYAAVQTLGDTALATKLFEQITEMSRHASAVVCSVSSGLCCIINLCGGDMCGTGYCGGTTTSGSERCADGIIVAPDGLICHEQA